jgi:tRNA pseudouridine55 synthase
MNALLVLNKPAGITSRDAVNVVEAWFPGVRVGHAGTLDPAATGILVICLGSATRLVEYVQQMPKTYAASIRLGAISDTDDAQGHIQIASDAVMPTQDQVQAALSEFVGEIDQVPPAYSAAHVEGRRAHSLARRGKVVELQPRRVRIDHITLVRYAFPNLALEVECGKGTYIRSLARDLGQRLGCGALLESLQRIRIGPFHVQNAVPLDAGPDAARLSLLPISLAVGELPKLVLENSHAQRLGQGQRLRLDELPLPRIEGAAEIAVFNNREELVAVATWSPESRLLRPEKVFSTSA